MSSFHYKPELALRRALELREIRQEDAALALLHEVLSNRRNRTWSPAYEQIMITYLDLCLDLHKSREAKDGLHQYRNLSQSQAPGSLEKVIRYLMEQAERKCDEAQKFALELENRTAEEDDEEEGFAASPQAILLSTMSTDPAKSQRDSTVLLPSLKFLWETYRAILDILRSNSKLEFVYHAAAQNALQFCQTYKRRMEFRHLCDMLRLHLGNLRQYGGDEDTKSNKVRGWEGWSQDSVELHLQTRFAQLETASVLHRYTEGFRTVEDIYNILQIGRGKTPPKAKLMAAYYEKLTTLFWVSENYLFHAFAWYKYYSLCREFHRGMSEEMKQRQASAVLLAALCIPPNYNSSSSGGVFQDDVMKQKMSRMAVLLGFHTRHPTREVLLQEIKSKNLLDQVPEYLRDLYNLLEQTQDPVIMVEQTQPLLERLRKEVGSTYDQDTGISDNTLGRYVKPLENALLLRLIVNLNQAYHTVSLDYLQRLTTGITFHQIEKSLVQFTQTKAITVRIDHRAGCLRFGATTDWDSSQLTVLGKSLEKVSNVIHPPAPTDRVSEYQRIRDSLDDDHAGLLKRKELIEKRKEQAERDVQEKVRLAAQRKAEEDAARKAEEERRIAREQRMRELEKQRKIQQELDNQEKKRFLTAMGKNTDTMTDEQISQIDTEALQREHQEKINKKKEEAERKTKEAAKKLDYMVRAIRIEELPLIKKKYEEKLHHDRELYEKENEEKVKIAQKRWEEDVEAKKTLEEHSVFSYCQNFEQMVMTWREAEHEILCAEAERKAEAEAERAKFRRARKRKDDEAKRQAEEEARLIAEEEERKAAEEKQKRDEAKREKEAAEEKGRQAELRRMDDDRKKKDGKYVPPALRGRTGGASGSGGAGDQRRFGGGDAGGYPGGGRYDGRGGGSRPEGRSDNDRWR